MGKLRMVSYTEEPFTDRTEAGRFLEFELKEFRDKGAVVLGIPRGGIIVAREISHSLNADLDIVLSRKLGAPYNPELAIGAISEDGRLFLDELLASHVGADKTYIQKEKAHQLAEIASRIARYRKVYPKISLKNRMVIVTDDGVATGATMKAALWAARQEGSSELIAAIPVGPEETVRSLVQYTDELVCLRVPSSFFAVGQFYLQFEQIEDEDVLKILKEEHEKKGKR